jgi:hypothetical protein
VIARSREREADANLAVGDLACRAGVLPLDADGVLALLEKARVVEDPRLHEAVLGQRFDCIPRREQSQFLVVPRRLGQEVQHPLMLSVGPRRVGAGPRDDRLDTLALAVSQEPHCVPREQLASSGVSQYLADLLEVVAQPALRRRVHCDVHGTYQITRRSPRQRF